MYVQYILTETGGANKISDVVCAVSSAGELP